MAALTQERDELRERAATLERAKQALSGALNATRAEAAQLEGRAAQVEGALATRTRELEQACAELRARAERESECADKAEQRAGKLGADMDRARADIRGVSDHVLRLSEELRASKREAERQETDKEKARVRAAAQGWGAGSVGPGWRRARQRLSAVARRGG